LAEAFQALVHPLIGSLVRELSALDVGLIGVWSLGRALGKPARFFPRQLQTDGLRNTLRERVLQRKDVGEFPVEGIATEVGFRVGAGKAPFRAFDSYSFRSATMGSVRAERSAGR
jgi:hypothetical protein